jgi:hypothetical protein
MNHQHQPPHITTAAYLANHRNTPQLRGSYGAHGYGILFYESYLIPQCHVIIVQHEGVMVTPPHYHKFTDNFLSRP